MARGRRRWLILGLAAAATAAVLFSPPVQDWLGTERARLRFNWIYSHDAPYFPKRPTALLAEMITGVKPGRALDVAMGQGRNAVYLAVQGWEVTGFDIADAGLAVARRDAEKAGVRINAVLGNCKNFDYGVERWDLIVMTYAPVPYHDPAYMKRIRDAVRPGGAVLVETFLDFDPSKPGRRMDGLPNPGELAAAFRGFVIERDEEKEGLSEWFHRQTRIVRFFARRKAAE